MNSRESGRSGEKLAENYLISKGYKFVARNFKVHPGEVDLIFIDGTDLVFIEVKSWKYLSFPDLEYSIDRRKQWRIIAVSKIFMADNWSACKDYNARYDVIFIDRNENITHCIGVFGEY